MFLRQETISKEDLIKRLQNDLPDKVSITTRINECPLSEEDPNVGNHTVTIQWNPNL